MSKIDNLFASRKSLDQICVVPDKIISVYSLEKHVWADSNTEASRKARRPELRTLEEFQLDPVRPFLTDILRNMAAPYKPERKDSPIGQGYWIQAEFGSGKSHLLCFLSALALGRQEAWEIVREKEQKAGRGKRESLYRFWEEGLEAKSGKGKNGILVIVKTLVGAGGGTVGLSDKGQRLSEYILDAAKEQLQLELNRNLSLYPTELLADRFLSDDLDRYRADLKKFLRSPKFFEEDEFEEVDDFIHDIQQNKSPEYKRSCGNKLWRFYTEYLKVQPQIAAETEEILKHMVQVILAEGYSGVLLVLDEVSLFMKNRSDDQRTDDEKTLVVLANRLAKIHNLPIWTVCAAQQAIESKMGVKNIIADDRLKLVKLLEEDKDYYEIVLSRVREVKSPGAIGPYYLHYKRGFTWPNSIGEKEFSHFFPFHKPAIEVLRAITYELTTTRSAIHFMHQTLKHQVKSQGRELIRLWELFDEAVSYEEDPSGVHAGLVAMKTQRETEYRAYEACKRQIDGLTKGSLKVHRDKAIKTVQTLFLYHIARTRQQGITPEEIANSVLIERDPEANADENIQHYETLAENLKKELRQIVQSFDEDGRPRYRFDPVFTGVDPRDAFRKARDEAESNALMTQEAWEHLLALDEWAVRTRQMTLDLSQGVRSLFREIAPFVAPWEKSKVESRKWKVEPPALSLSTFHFSLSATEERTLEVHWQGRQVAGLIAMRDLGRIASERLPLPPIESDQTDRDFAVWVSIKPLSQEVIDKLLVQRQDPRILLWAPGELTHEERERLIDFAAYRKLISDWQGKETEDAVAVVHWVANTLQTELGRIAKIVDNRYARGRIDALNHSQMEFHVAGELSSILTPLVDRVLTTVYESRDLRFDPPFLFRKEEGVKGLKNYRDLERFLVYEAELRAAYAYVTESRKWQVEGPKDPLRLPLSACHALRRKLEQLQPYIDSEVRLKTELIGRTPPEAGETGTLGVLIHEYATVYAALHDSVMDRLEDCRREIHSILQGDALISLKILEKITALQPAVSDGLERQLSGLAERLFPCPASSRISVEEQLKRGPTHGCGLSFQNASEHLEAAESAAKEARTLLEEALDRKLEVFLNPAVRERLHQGESEPVIANLLNGKSLVELRAYLVGASLVDASIVEIINRYLKRISVKRVKIADFKPSIGTVEKGQIAGLAQEFQGYLEGHLKEIAGDDDTLPMLQME